MDTKVAHTIECWKWPRPYRKTGALNSNMTEVQVWSIKLSIYREKSSK